MASSFAPYPSFWNARTATPTMTTKKLPFQSTASARSMSTSSVEPSSSSTKAMPNFNSVDVAKQGGIGMATASEQALEQNLSLGAPPARPKGGHFMTKGGIQVTSNVSRLEFSKALKEGTSESAIEHLIDQLDSHKGVLLTSSYEFPGRYARWSLGMIDPPIEVSGRADQCSIRALNDRGKILMPAIVSAMEQLKVDGVLQSLHITHEETPNNGVKAQMLRVDVKVVPPPEVGTFSEEERSRQVRKQNSLFVVVVNVNDGKSSCRFAPAPTHYAGFYLSPFSVVVEHSSLLFSQSYDRWSTCLDIKVETDNWGYMERLDTT
jgi:hypothetical protein